MLRPALVACVILVVCAWPARAQPPVVTVTTDNTLIDRSCLVRIPPGTVIVDADSDGAIHIKGQGIVVEFEAKSVLVGTVDAPGDQLTGIGVSIDGGSDITIRNAAVSGYKTGIFAARCDGLTVDGADLSGNFRQHLRSTPQAEDAADWLWPHENDGHEWRTNYGAGLCVEESKAVTIRGVRVREGQNGIVLDRVDDSRVYDNDCSFLSGWGIAMWRCRGNIISRNAVDFCVRGHSEGVYNRGQDSAGFLVFEQCHHNTFIENSASHGGDAFFGFAGKEAIGERDPAAFNLPPERIGCNDNLLIDNDFSYAPAHGIEMTFSRGNRFIHNRVVENAICGVWAGYSNDTLIADNRFEGNGGMAYGLECGGINIEHGSGNRIINNRFINNRCGVHLWWDDDAGLLKLPGVKATDRGVKGNVIAGNRFEITAAHPFTGPKERSGPLVALRLRDTGDGHVSDTLYTGNVLELTDPRAREFDVKPGLEPRTQGQYEAVYPDQEVRPIGETSPVGRRAELRGRSNIIMGEWGPWDHRTPMVRHGKRESGLHVYEVFGAKDIGLQLVCDASARMSMPAGTGGPTVIEVRPNTGTDVSSYTLSLNGTGLKWTTSDTFVRASWEVVAFPWSKDPRADLAGYNADRLRVPQAAVTLPEINFNFGGGGPRDLPQFAEVKDKAPGPDHFGIVAVSTLTLPRGSWKFTTLSDDGVRVKVTSNTRTTTVIDNWTWHGPTRDSGVFKQEADGPVSIAVEYFEIDGHAVLQLAIEPGE